MRNPSKNEWHAKPAPKRLAITISRINPVKRLSRTAKKNNAGRAYNLCLRRQFAGCVSGLQVRSLVVSTVIY